MRESGFGEYVKRSFSRNPKYYVVEKYEVLKTLEKYRKSIKVK
jgi:hypothetical protein